MGGIVLDAQKDPHRMTFQEFPIAIVKTYQNDKNDLPVRSNEKTK